MNLKDETRAILQQFHLAPNKDAGQHFMIDANLLQKIVDAAQLKPTDTVVEVGPGLGMLTRELLPKVAKVIAVEVDRKFLPVLESLAQRKSNLHIVCQDILRLNMRELLGDTPFHIVSNLPYHITSRFLRLALEDMMQHQRLQTLTLVIQDEVAERMVAQPGDMSLLSLSVQFFTQPTYIQAIPPSAFYPEPEVTSALIHLTRRDTLPFADVKHFFRIARIGFSAKRKKLLTNLVNGHCGTREELERLFEKLHLLPTARAQELSIQQWCDLAHAISPSSVLDQVRN